MHSLPVLIHVVLGIPRYGAELLAVAAEHLRVEGVFAPTAVAKLLHHGVDLLLEHLSQLRVQTSMSSQISSKNEDNK